MIDQLRTMAIFQTVAETGSFRQAAKNLNLSPSVISHHITKLEDELGAPPALSLDAAHVAD
jgi:DNA-binding transcriptional LysR family regulator